jgi:uncharacterized protein YjeT (DUF2065 family)
MSKIHCSPEAWKSMVLMLGESSPAMAEQFRLVKYYVVYPDSWKKIRTVSPSLGE